MSNKSENSAVMKMFYYNNRDRHSLFVITQAYELKQANVVHRDNKTKHVLLFLDQ